MARRSTPSAFDVKLSADQRKDLADELCREIEDAFTARSPVIGDGGAIDLIDWFYEQGQSDPQDRPFKGAADLTSYFITENVDALKARLMQAVFGAEPFCAVDGWGPDAQKAPFVESFHEWQVEEEGLQTELGKTILGALLEGGHILEVRERVETRRIVEEVDCALATNADGAAIFGADHQPMLRLDEAGDPIPPQDGEPSAKVRRSYTKTRRLGPEYDVVSMKDFVFLPGHAKNSRQVWGYAKRFWQRVPVMQELAEDGVYDADAVKEVGEESDRDGSSVAAPSVSQIAPQTGKSAEKELYELSLKRDLDGDGREEWYVVTLSLVKRTILRLKLDKFVMKVGKSRCVPFILFPRRNSVYGYSYAGDKLLTLAEEHTALRNMKADRSALATNAPLLVLQGSAWNPDTDPIGVGSVIRVRQPNEIQPLTIPDVPVSVVEQERTLIAAKERVGGLADTAIGVQSAERRTLGENEMVASASAVRVEEVLGHLREAIQAVMQLRHAIWVETLEAEQKGLEAPARIAEALEVNGAALQSGRFTAALLKGKFQFKPAGSVETADAGRRIAYFNQSLQALGGLAQAFPTLQPVLASPEVGKAILEQWAVAFKVRNRMPFLRAFQQAMQAAQQQAQLPPAGGMDAGAPMGEPPLGGGGLDPAALLASLTGGGVDAAGGY